MNAHGNTGSLIQVTEHPVTPDTEDPECTEREKVASQSRQDKRIPQAGKKKIFLLQSTGEEGKGIGKKKLSIDANIKNCKTFLSEDYGEKQFPGMP